jgi:hypothetical protein
MGDSGSFYTRFSPHFSLFDDRRNVFIAAIRSNLRTNLLARAYFEKFSIKPLNAIIFIKVY